MGARPLLTLRDLFEALGLPDPPRPASSSTRPCSQLLGILDGDLAICEPRQYAQNGEIVVALINNEEATVKRFFLRKKYIELRPENTDYKPLRYGFDEILVQGKGIGMQRGPEGIR